MPITPNLDTERALIRQTLGGSSHAFSQLVSLYQGDLRIFLRRILFQSSNCDDVAQEAFLKAYRNLYRFRFECSFKTWLFRIAHNEAKSSMRRRSFETNEIEIEFHRDNRPDPARAFEAKMELEKMFSILTLEQRKVLSLSYGSGFSHEEISKILDMPLGTVKSHALRGKEKAVAHLNQGGALSQESENE